MSRMLHLRSAVLGPDDGEFARGARNVLNLPFDVDAPEGRTQCAVFVRVRGKLMKDEVQRECQERFKLDVRPGRQDLSAICAVGTHGLLKQLSKPKPTAVVACELAKTVKAGNPGHKLGPVIFDARRVRLLDRCFDHREQISNSVIEFAEQKSHAVFVQTEFSTLSSHLSLRYDFRDTPGSGPLSPRSIGRPVADRISVSDPSRSRELRLERPMGGVQVVANERAG